MTSKRSILFILLGALLIVSACALAAYYAYEDQQAKKNAAQVLAMVEEAGYEHGDNRVSPSKAAEEAELLKRFDENEYGVIGVLTLEKPDIRLPVFGEYSTENLKITVCRYEGDYFAENGKMVIAGHNYKSHFGNLSQMCEGDTVCFTNIYGEEYQFYVTAMIEIGGSDTAALEEGDWTLSLLTCAFDRTKRIIVRCQDA